MSGVSVSTSSGHPLHPYHQHIKASVTQDVMKQYLNNENNDSAPLMYIYL